MVRLALLPGEQEWIRGKALRLDETNILSYRAELAVPQHLRQNSSF